MKILCLGDSLTDCNRFFSEDPLGDGYVSMLSQCAVLSEHFQFINRGVDGFTVSRLLESARSQYLSLRPDLITILIGINDIALMQNTRRTEAQKEKMMQDFLNNYESLLRILRFSSNKTILMEPFIFPYPSEFSSWEPYLKTMSGGIQRLTEKYQLIFLPLQAVLSAAADTYGYPAITLDGVHLTEKGHSILADQLKPLIYPSKQ